MKKLYTLIAFAIIVISAKAQNDINLRINHFLGTKPFTFNTTATNNLDNDFQLQRFEYYISSIVITHDSGLTTAVPSKWILVDADSTTIEFLGNFPITTVESIQFSIGVEGASNHNDPALYASNHPLAPKSPSMHWGWSAGYRFVAMEGMTGTNMNEIFQIHALGDRNYRSQTITVAAVADNGSMTINLNADYLETVKNITINSNLLNHGEQNEAATMLSNFSRNGVYSQSTVGINESKRNLISFGVSPNPSNKDVFVTLSKSLNNITYKIIDLTGREVKIGKLNSTDNNRISIENRGIFMLNLYEEGEFIGTEKVIIQ